MKLNTKLKIHHLLKQQINIYLKMEYSNRNNFIVIRLIITLKIRFHYQILNKHKHSKHKWLKKINKNLWNQYQVSLRILN